MTSRNIFLSAIANYIAIPILLLVSMVGGYVFVKGLGSVPYLSYEAEFAIMCAMPVAALSFFLGLSFSGLSVSLKKTFSNRI